MGRGDRTRRWMRTALLAAAVPTAAAVAISLLGQRSPAPAGTVTVGVRLTRVAIPMIPPTPRPTPGPWTTPSPDANPATPPDPPPGTL